MSNSTPSTTPPPAATQDWRRTGYYVLIIALAALFGLQWGPGASGCDRFGKLEDTKGEPVATVNGQTVPLKDFIGQYQAQAQQFRAQGVPPEFLKQFGIHKQVVDRLVNTELLAQTAEAQGLRATDDEVVAIILKDTSFQRDGKFDRERYSDIIMQYEQMTTVQFEEKLRRQLSAQKVLQLVESSVAVSDDEVKARYQKEGNAAKATFVRLTPSMYADRVATPKPADLQKWADANAALLAADYEANKFKYFIDERVKARQILLRVARDADAATKDDAKKRLENVRRQIVDEKKPFAELASSVSEDTETKDKGGDLGFIERSQLPSDFATKLFALKPGEVTEVTESPIGFHLGVVEDRKAPETKPLEAVKGELAAALYVKEKARELAKADADKALAELKKGKTLAELFPADAKDDKSNQFNFKAETKPEVKETGEFNASADAVPTLGGGAAVFKQLMDQKEKGVIDQVVVVDDGPAATTSGFAVVVLDERKLPSDEDFASKREQLFAEAVKGKQFEVREAFLKALKAKATVTTNDKAIDKVVGGEG
ncbi:MAG: SurA N-terminal domain-containing protein [Myxococcaceae bacterium]|jgi:peptidyl-prolyl cis-trans isomerase D|nr:SurA N-terminal domain-containing protein [Myxococcaceae bacterium]MCA3014834.1 SurA N-terminal domain-containing protein [Myxococcaceae bacterium]